MILVTLSVLVTIIVLNVNFRSPSTHRMAPWVKKVFIEYLPRLLCITRPPRPQQLSEWELNALPTRGTEISILPQAHLQPGDMELARPPQQMTATIKPPSRLIGTGCSSASNNGRSGQLENGGCQQHCPAARKRAAAAGLVLPVEMDHSIEDVRFIAQHMRNKDRFDSVSPLARFSLSLSLSSFIDPSSSPAAQERGTRRRRRSVWSAGGNLSSYGIDSAPPLEERGGPGCETMPCPPARLPPFPSPQRDPGESFSHLPRPHLT